MPVKPRSWGQRSGRLALGAIVGGIQSAGMLRDRKDLKFLTGCTNDIPNGFAHQKPCYRGYEGNRAGLGVRFILSHDTIFLYAPIVAPEGHRAAKGNSVS